MVDTEGRIRNFNRAVEVASGLDDRARIEGQYFWDIFIDPDEREAMIERFRDAAPDFPAAEYENVFTNARGQERVIAWQTAPLVDENGDVVRIIAGGIDITDRKRREVELQRQWDFANTVANTIPSFIVVTDHEAVVVPHGANRAFCETFGRTIEELEGASFLELVARDDEFAARMAIAGAANGVPQAERETRWLTRDGERADGGLDRDADPRPVGRATGAGLRGGRHRAQAPGGRGESLPQPDRGRDRRRAATPRAEPPRRRAAAPRGALPLAATGGVEAPDRPEQASEILVGARDELAQALEELRELARGLHPNVLTDRGLGPALEALVMRSPIPVEVDAPDERFPPAIEAAAYYVAAEALANVAKYARGDVRPGARRSRTRRRARSSWRSWTTASAAPTRRAARASEASRTGSSRSTARSRSRARPAAGLAFARRSRPLRARFPSERTHAPLGRPRRAVAKGAGDRTGRGR